MMKALNRRSIFLFALIIGALNGLGLANPARGEDVPGLLKYLPYDVNTISVIRVGEIMKSPLAVKEDWKGQQEARFLAGSARIPPWVDVLVSSSQIRGGRTTLSFGLTNEPGGATIEQLVPKNKKVDTEMIAEQPVLRTQHGLVTEMKSGILAFMTPQDRQAFSFWLRNRRTNPQVQLSEYLRSTATAQKPHILFAYDLEDALTVAALKHRVAAAKDLRGNQADQQAVLQLLQTLKGIRLSINIENDISANLIFDFTGAVTPAAAKYLKLLLDELLDDNGAHIDELENATLGTDTRTNVVLIQTKLTDAGLRRIMTLILPPVSTQKYENSPTDGKPEAAATQKYMQSVNGILRDLENLNRKAKEYNKTATWHDNFAKKINDLPIANVDSDAVDYGNWIASNLRSLAGSLRGVPIQVNQLEGKIESRVNITTAYPEGYKTAWGYTPAPWEVSSNVNEVRAAQQEAVNQNAQQRDQVWRGMADENARVKAKLTQRYNVKF